MRGLTAAGRAILPPLRIHGQDSGNFHTEDLPRQMFFRRTSPCSGRTLKFLKNADKLIIDYDIQMQRMHLSAFCFAGAEAVRARRCTPVPPP